MNFHLRLQDHWKTCKRIPFCLPYQQVQFIYLLEKTGFHRASICRSSNLTDGSHVPKANIISFVAAAAVAALSGATCGKRWHAASHITQRARDNRISNNRIFNPRWLQPMRNESKSHALLPKYLTLTWWSSHPQPLWLSHRAVLWSPASLELQLQLVVSPTFAKVASRPGSYASRSCLCRVLKILGACQTLLQH